MKNTKSTQKAQLTLQNQSKTISPNIQAVNFLQSERERKEAEIEDTNSYQSEG